MDGDIHNFRLVCTSKQLQWRLSALWSNITSSERDRTFYGMSMCKLKLHLWLNARVWLILKIKSTLLYYDIKLFYWYKKLDDNSTFLNGSKVNISNGTFYLILVLAHCDYNHHFLINIVWININQIY